MISVDAFDLKILAALQDDGRLTNQQLADVAGLSASQCSRRRMRLEEEKVIAGYHADLASEALGFNVIAFIHITLATHSPDNANVSRAGQPRRRHPGGLFADRRRRLPAEGGAARPEEPVRYRQQRADAAPERGACALLDRAGSPEGKREIAAEGVGAVNLTRHSGAREATSPESIITIVVMDSGLSAFERSRNDEGDGRNRGRFGLRIGRSICDHLFRSNQTRTPWRCNSGRTANIATRTCRRIRRKRGSAAMSARSVRIASRPN